MVTKNKIIFSIIIALAIIGCGGNGGGDNDPVPGKMVIKSNVDSINPNITFNRILTAPFKFAYNMFVPNLYADSGIEGSPFTKVNGIGFYTYPSIMIYTARNGNYKCWQVTDRDVSPYEPSRGLNASIFVSETQKLTYSMLNKFYNFEGTLSEVTYEGTTYTYYKLIEIDAPEAFEVDYVICTFGYASIYGETASGNNYAPAHIFFDFNNNTYNAYNEAETDALKRIRQDSVHPMVPDMFKSYALLEEGGINVSTKSSKATRNAVIFSTKVTTPVVVAAGDYGDVTADKPIPDDLRTDLIAIFKGMKYYSDSDSADVVVTGGAYVVVPMSWLGYGNSLSISAQQALTMESPIEVTIDLQKTIAEYYSAGGLHRVGITKPTTEILSPADLPFDMKFVCDTSILR